MNIRILQQKLDTINDSISFWEERSEKIFEKTQKYDVLGVDISDLRAQFKFCYKKILFEKSQLEKIEDEYKSYMKKSKKIRRGHYQKSFLS